MKFKIKRKEVGIYLEGLGSVSNIVADYKFAYAVSKNFNKFKSEYEKIREKQLPEKTKELDKFEAEKLKLIEIHGERNVSGKLILNNGKYKIKDEEKYQKEHDELLDKHKTVKSQLENHVKEYSKYLDDVIEIEIHTIKKDILPEKISANQLNAIDFMID